MIQSIDAGEITDAVVAFLATIADISVDSSGVVGEIEVGDGEAPNRPAGHPTQTAVDRVTNISTPYLVLRQIPLGAGIDRDARSGYGGGTPSTRLMRFQISGLGPSRQSAQRVATAAAARLTDIPYVTIPNLGRHEISRRERFGDGFDDRVGDLHQWTELVDLDVAFAP